MGKKIITLFAVFATLGLAGVAHAEEFVSVCARSPHVRVTLETQLQKPCFEIGAEDLATLDYFQIGFDDTLAGLTEGDLVGMPAVIYLYLNCNDHLQHVPADLVVGKTHLDTLAIHSNPLLKALPEELFKELQSTTDIRVMLMGNGLSHLPESFYDHFANRTGTFRIDLDNNPWSDATLQRLAETFGDDLLIETDAFGHESIHIER